DRLGVFPRIELERVLVAAREADARFELALVILEGELDLLGVVIAQLSAFALVRLHGPVPLKLQQLLLDRVFLGIVRSQESGNDGDQQEFGTHGGSPMEHGTGMIPLHILTAGGSRRKALFADLVRLTEEEAKAPKLDLAAWPVDELQSSPRMR